MMQAQGNLLTNQLWNKCLASITYSMLEMSHISECLTFTPHLTLRCAGRGRCWLREAIRSWAFRVWYQRLCVSPSPKTSSWGVKPHFGDWEILCVKCNFSVFSLLKEKTPIVLFLQLLTSLCSFPTNSSGRLPLALYTSHTNFHLRESILRICIPLLDKFHSVNTSRDLKKLF